jgi:hypothetical protein
MATKAIVDLKDLKVLDGTIVVEISVLYEQGEMKEISTQKVFGTIPTGLTDSSVTTQLKSIASGLLLEFAGLTITPAEIVRGR